MVSNRSLARSVAASNMKAPSSEGADAIHCLGGEPVIAECFLHVYVLPVNLRKNNLAHNPITYDTQQKLSRNCSRCHATRRKQCLGTTRARGNDT